LKNRGTLALYGEASGEVPAVEVRRLVVKSLYLTRTGLGSYIFDDAEFKWRAEEVMAWLGSGKIKQSYKAMPLSQAADAHRALQSRGTIGKIILIPDAI
jgi:NADPH2:quinone reductase